MTRGYFPKELPPAFFTERFGKYANTKSGRQILANYKPTDNYTECVKYFLALPGGHRRELKIPHPASFSMLAGLSAKNFRRLLSKAGKSPFSKSRPIYASNRLRALQTAFTPSSLGTERALRRAGGSFILRADVSQFYPSLYTHAVGWAIDPKSRKKIHWKNPKLLGNKLDQALMNLDGKLSQGIPIGNDISFLLAECVLAQVDAALAVSSTRGYRWFDDYEVAFDTQEQAEACMKRLTSELARFRLRLNPIKTKIVRLPRAAEEEWQMHLAQTGGRPKIDARGMVKHFDTAFRLREQYPDSHVLLYALGVLFGINCPSPQVGRIAQSCLTQALLCEPGAAQKAFALISYWLMNGFSIDAELLTGTINQLILRHQASGPSSDVAWALSFCIDQGLMLDSKAGKALSRLDDDCIALQALHMSSLGLLPKGFTTSHISKTLKNVELDREHWLIGYEAVRQGFLNDSEQAVNANPLFSDFLKNKVSFYRNHLPKYASVVHSGGAPQWVVRKWIESSLKVEATRPGMLPGDAIPKQIADDLARWRALLADASAEEAVAGLLDLPEGEALPDEDGSTYLG